MRIYPDVKRNEILSHCPGGKDVFDNIEITLKNSIKYKLFSQRILGEKKAILEGDDLLNDYLSTTDTESYNDSLNSAKLCKKLSYFLFTICHNQFSLTERSQISDRLRKHENRLPATSIEIYNLKKNFIDMMHERNVTHNQVLFKVIRHIHLLHDSLESQQMIYRIEYKLIDDFLQYLHKGLIPLFSKSDFKLDPAKTKALLQVIIAIRQRGLELEEVKGSISTGYFQSLANVLAEQKSCLKAEIKTIDEVRKFLLEAAKYADPPESLIKQRDAMGESKFMSTIRKLITARIAQWLSS
ncbi:MAG: hypothetical protein JXR73_22625 [Candidatus Omnitrophica bacterium]|nr:hypothetical protein [Candidatus Omnitrophota bacterium]